MGFAYLILLVVLKRIKLPNYLMKKYFFHIFIIWDIITEPLILEYKYGNVVVIEICEKITKYCPVKSSQIC